MKSIRYYLNTSPGYTQRSIFFLFFLWGSISFAQTNITTPTVSGTWTLAGSPYIVQTVINVPAGQSLTIQPGVNVKFQPATKLTIDGELVASGTSGQPIVFEATDTNSWSDESTTVGGWGGIHYMQYTGGGTDHSTFNNCILRDAKYGYSSAVQYMNAFSCERSLKILNSTFEHNSSGTGSYQADAPLFLYTWQPADTIEVNNCIMTDNTSTFGIVRSCNYLGGHTRILKSNLHHNFAGSTIWGIFNDLLIEDNLVHHNTMQNDNSPIKISIGKTIIRGNKVYNNECDQLAAVGCRSGQVTIENNLICNNRQNDGACGAVGGGGGVHIAHNEGAADFNDTYYIVRNNIIANNYSAYGGGGIYVYTAKATIANNHIINNYTPYFGRGILVLSPSSEVNLRNNLFYSESTLGIVDTTNIIFILSANTMQVDYNYLPGPYHQVASSSFGYTLVGDTIHNVIGTHPNMVAPTADNDLNTSALSADFELMANSPCINHGDTTGAFPSAIDYNGQSRILGPIDIGAYEYRQLEGEENVLLSYATLSAYPNPVATNGTVSIYTPENKGNLVIQDLSGRTLHQQPVTTTQNTLTWIPESKGIYLVSFYGKKTATCRIIVN